MTLLDEIDSFIASRGPTFSTEAASIVGKARAEIERLRAALRRIADRTEDHKPPYRVMSVAAMAQIAEDALAVEQKAHGTE